MDEGLYDTLHDSQCAGLTWAWRCDSCMSNFEVQDDKNVDITNKLESETTSMKDELSREIKREINDIWKLFDNRLKDMETRSLPSMMSEISKEVESQINDVISHIST